ncbi:MAG: hypothetical protein ABI583_01285 [Betaproteobacteria bacterium]
MKPCGTDAASLANWGLLQMKAPEPITPLNERVNFLRVEQLDVSRDER